MENSGVCKQFCFPIEIACFYGRQMLPMRKMITYDGKLLMVKPFCLMIASMLPTRKIRTELDTKWKPVYCKMMEAPGVQPILEDVKKEIHRAAIPC